SGVTHPAAECEAGVEQADIREASLPQDRFVLLWREDGEVRIDSGRLAWIDAGVCCVSRQPNGAPVALRNAEVRDDEGRPRLQTAASFGCRALPLLERQEVQRHETGRSVERPARRVLRMALMQSCSRGERSQGSFGQFQ